MKSMKPGQLSRLNADSRQGIPEGKIVICKIKLKEPGARV